MKVVFSSIYILIDLNESWRVFFFCIDTDTTTSTVCFFFGQENPNWHIFWNVQNFQAWKSHQLIFKISLVPSGDKAQHSLYSISH